MPSAFEMLRTRLYALRRRIAMALYRQSRPYRTGDRVPVS